nr:MAG TPA: hypothetical protein [Caudoviricetes sp.]
MYIGWNVVFTSRIYGGRLPPKHRCSKVTEFLQQPSDFYSYGFLQELGFP